jgi:hypothetical protein
MFRIVRNDQHGEMLADSETIEQAIAIIGSTTAGRFHIDEISADPLLSGHTARRWGTIIKQVDGSITTEPDPWPQE